MNTIISNGTPISYNVYGSGPATLLFVHGSFIDQTYWKEQVSFFKEKYKVVTMDLAGHGESGTNREEWTLRGMAEDVVNLIKELRLDDVVLIGHSLGANLILMAATAFPEPVIGFIAVDNFKNLATPLPPEYDSQVTEIIESSKKAYADTNEHYARMALFTAGTPQWITDKVVSAFRNSYEPMGRQTLPQFFIMDQIEREVLPLLKPKMNLINVNYMPTNVEALKKNAVNGYALIEIAGTCHYPMLESPKALNEALDEVIDGVLEAKITA
ncbi:Pimeloyl-ACP methyl ester carboxylesterase [Dyadobacter sp. SG02]|uniref:alpha/beta fold hydrolase n=1 Tax=Dyadobacter sp. SG02 TaxID=1855291 RepID=UPI0008C576A5|nr:alpha/beta hydrolase [Dyadobacter sp. SG02]SEJ85096.1 Pimeloyl-ACP methyl ester carboxylesterase [Dyadobacter sp. SG02]